MAMNTESDLRPLGLTVAQYAAAKRLPEEFLRKLGARDIHLGKMPAVAFPYKDLNGNEIAVRFRLTMDSAGDRFRWRNGSKQTLYGLWRQGDYIRKKAKYIFLPEGESDSQTLWHHHFPTLGLPGAGSWQEDWSMFLEPFERIYVPIEPDNGGETVLGWLTNSKIRQRVHLLRLTGAKDISELFLSDADRFVRNLKAAVRDAQPWQEYARAQEEQQAKALRAECRDIAKSANILQAFAEQLKQLGLAGESRKARLLYLALTSRLLQKPVSIGLKGPSSSGKSHLVERVLEHFPPEAFYFVTAMSERALAYSEEPMKHRFIVLAEAAALAGDFLSYLIRSLLSEGRLSYVTVEKVGGKLSARRIEREGPTGLLVTTTAISLHSENETRFLSLRINDSARQTARILLAEANKVSLTKGVINKATEEIPKWQALQRWLTVARRPVLVPFAPALAKMIPPVAVRLRRDFNAMLSLIQAHALLYIANREVTSEGYILATLDDYRHVRSLVNEVMTEGLEVGVSKEVCETVSAVSKLCDGVGVTATITQVAKELKLDRSAANRRIHECLRRNYLQTEEEIRKGRLMKLKIGEPLPGELEVLPTVEALENAVAKAEKIGRKS
jgi:hypothetical protein